MSATSVGIIPEGTVVTLDAASVGVVVGFTLPANEYNEFRVDGLADTRELYKRSSKRKGQILKLVIRHDAKTKLIADNDTGTWLFTLPKQDSGSTTASSFSMDGFVLTTGELDGSPDSADGMTQEIDIRLDSEITPVLES